MEIVIQTEISRLRGFIGAQIELAKVYGIIKPLQFFHRNRCYDEKLDIMRNMEKGTTGRAIADMLDTNRLKLIPKFEEHDLKHTLLGYGMSPEEELRMQAYLLGNGNRSLFCSLFLSSGIFLPWIWKQLREDYDKGKNAPSILDIKIDESLPVPLYQLINKYRG